MKLRYVCAVLLFLLPRSVAGQLRVPAPVGYVNDFAGVIPQPQRDSIQRIIDEVRAKSGGEIVVVTLPRLEGQPVEDVALQIGRDWKIGQKGAPTDSARNTGTVLLIVPKESSDDGKGHLWIATGTGTSRFFTAAQAGRIRDSYMIPAFREGAYGTGILLGVIGIAARYADAFHFQLTGVALPQDTVQPVARHATRIPFVVWIIIIFVVLSVIRGGGGGRTPRPGCPGGSRPGARRARSRRAACGW